MYTQRPTTNLKKKLKAKRNSTFANQGNCQYSRERKKKAAVSLRVHTNKLAECHTEKGNVELQRVERNNKKKRQSSM